MTSPFEAGATQSNKTCSSTFAVVGVAGTEGTVAQRIEISSLSALYPKVFLASTLNLYV